MHREGHLGMALAVYAPIGFIAALIGGLQLAFFGGIVAAGLAMLPDIDMRIPLVKHRGITHTAWFALAVGLVVGLLGFSIKSSNGPLDSLEIGAFGSLVGTVSICSHLLADALTPAGIRPYWPLYDAEYTFGVARASSPIPNYLLFVFGVGICVAAFRLVLILN